ncbi:hypothetical protein [Halobaculum sp. EA56]|uniref:hypothetical protein n=1 Tax=Halobaculum sp. EA56 TaxID=3421648 RepID=UPI003EBC0F86
MTDRSPSDPSVSDHLRPTDADYPAGVYRVVGADDDGITLLRIGDGEGTRVHTGDVRRVPREALDGFAPAEPPGRGAAPGALLRGALSHLYWSTRAFLGSLRRRPLPTAVALALLAAGAVGEETLPVSAAGLDALVLLGSIGLVLVASGRV